MVRERRAAGGRQRYEKHSLDSDFAPYPVSPSLIAKWRAESGAWLSDSDGLTLCNGLASDDSRVGRDYNTIAG